MYTRKTQEDLNCGIVIAMKVLGAKWKPCILDAISKGYKRPSEIHKMIPEATPRVIDMQLKELENQGMVEKYASRSFPLHTEYFLTEVGHSILPVIQAMDKWGTKNARLFQQKAASVN
jgi:DNA-binding HxlR family transcriptional regulator